MSDYLLWDIVLGWFIEKRFRFKTIAIIDGYPIYQIYPDITNTFIPACTSYMLITGDKVQITSHRIEVSNYMGLQDLTLTGPVKTIMAGLPTFFEEMEQYLNRVPQPIVNYAPPDGGLQLAPLVPGGPSFLIHNCRFDFPNHKNKGPIKDETIIHVYSSMDPDPNV